MIDFETENHPQPSQVQLSQGHLRLQTYLNALVSGID